MAYNWIHHRRDGSVERKRVNVSGSVENAMEVIQDRIRDVKARMRDKRGWAPGKTMKLKASIPAVVWEEVLKNDGPEACRDAKYLIHRAQELGLCVRTKR